MSGKIEKCYFANNRVSLEEIMMAIDCYIFNTLGLTLFCHCERLSEAIAVYIFHTVVSPGLSYLNRIIYLNTVQLTR